MKHAQSMDSNINWCGIQYVKKRDVNIWRKVECLKCLQKGLSDRYSSQGKMIIERIEEVKTEKKRTKFNKDFDNIIK
jgi:ribosomal protein L37AE/L43A